MDMDVDSRIASSQSTTASTSPNHTAAPPKKSQACDACRLRKVKCNGAARCQQCEHLNLRCVYSAPRGRTRSSTKRGALISRYKAESAAGGMGGGLSDSAAASVSPTFPPSSDHGFDQRTPPTSDHAPTSYVGSPDGSASSHYHSPRLPSLMEAVPLGTGGNGAGPTSHASSPTMILSASDHFMSHDPSFFYSFLPHYEKCVYPMNPVVTTSEARTAISEMATSREARFFVYALAAVTTILTPETTEMDRQTLQRAQYWTDQAIAAKTAPRFAPPPSSPLSTPGAEKSSPSPRDIIACEFLHVTLAGLQNFDAAFYYMREAITLAYVLRLDDEGVMAALPAPERARRQRLYWELFIHERYYAMACYRPTIMAPLSRLPEMDPTIPAHVNDGFNQIIRLFRVIDGDFLRYWVASRTSVAGGDGAVSLAWIETKHREIDEEEAGSDQAIGNLTVMQQADLIVTKQWLRTLVWQLALSNCLLGGKGDDGGIGDDDEDERVQTHDNHATSPTSRPNGSHKTHLKPPQAWAPAAGVRRTSHLSLTFPLGLSASLRELISRMSRKDIEVHGAGIQEKFFEITDTIASVMLATPITPAPQSVRNVEDFVFLAKFVFSLPTFGILQRQILNEKLSALQRHFPTYHASSATSSSSVAALEQRRDHLALETHEIMPVYSPTMVEFGMWLDQTSLDASPGMTS